MKPEIIDHDPTPIWLDKFQKELAKLRKENNFDNKTYFKLNLSDAYHYDFTGMLKLIKQKKNYSMRTILLTTGTAPYRTSKYLVEIIKPTLNRNKHRVINSSSLVNGAATLETTEE